MSQNPYLFIVGCPRSGTTLLQRMLDHHPMVAVANDTHFIPKAFKPVGGASNLMLTAELIESVRSYHRFSRLRLPEASISKAAENAQTYEEFVSGLYSEYGLFHNKSLAGEKTPDYVRYLPLLHSLFPWVRTVHIIRDGRDVALSALNWAKENKGPGKFQLWRIEPLAVCALWWRWQVTTGQVDGGKLGSERYYEVKYENLVKQYEETLREITQFLELPFATEMLSYHEGKADYRLGLSAKKAWLPPTPGLRNWRTQMPKRDLELFEALAGDLLSTLGYERAFNSISDEVATIAQVCRDWWEREMTRRQAKRGRHYLKIRTQSGAPYDNSSPFTAVEH